MAFSLSSPVTGPTGITGLTNPTYTHVADTGPSVNSKQVAVTALGGTQTGVTVHSVAKPFTLTFFRPAVLQVLSAVDPVTGALRSVPRNNYGLLVRKGAIPLAGQPSQVCQMKTTFEIPAGTDSYEPAELKAALALLIGALTQQANGIADTLQTGII